MIDWIDKARTLTDNLAASGHLSDDQWRQAFQMVPRHLFVPRFWRDPATLLDGDDPATAAQWLEAVYSDQSLTTQYAPVPGTDLRWSTSSSTKPSLMAHMLGMLNIHTGHTVLEIGTGTGYNTALLCHRLGDTDVTSIDIDPDLVQDASRRLAALGYHPTLLAGDGANGVTGNAPYDRIIATCAVPTIPPPWIDQLAPSGTIVADLRGDLASSIAVLHKTHPDTVTGRFSAVPGHFMWLRADVTNPLRDGGEFDTVIDHDGADQHVTTFDPRVLNDTDLRFMLQLTDLTLQHLWRSQDNGTDTLHLSAEDGSWAQAQPHRDQTLITQGGPRRIWPTIEHATTRWNQLGRPIRDRFGLTATTTGTIRDYWLDQPSNKLGDLTVPA
jgi:methyltransferase of ATP-grasp peptide maturase system